MKGTNHEDRIIDVDGYTHIVDDKIMCFTPDTLDINKPENREFILGLAAGKWFREEEGGNQYGEDTFLFIDREDGSFRIEPGDWKRMPPEYRERLEKVRNEYRNKAGDNV